MAMVDSQVRLANLSDRHILLSLLIAFNEHLQMPIASPEKLYAALTKLMKDPMCDFILAVAANESGVAYTQIRYFYSLWSLGLEAKLEDVYVIPEVRGLGVGSRLLAFSIEQARQRQCRLIALNTNERNIAAKTLYTQNGFNCQPLRWQGGQQLWFEKTL